MGAESDSPDRQALLSRAVLELRQMKAKLEKAEQAKKGPIAIVGIGCRLPGQVNDPDGLWRLLAEGRDAVRPVPPTRWDIKSYYDPNPGAVGKMYTRAGGFLDEVDTFDPRFFGLTPREAIMMDPQHRLVLELSWEALEHAGISPDSLSGSRTGVFVGISNGEYGQLQRDLSRLDAYFLTGNALNFVAGRISYLLGLQGPAMAIDSACSSSLVGVHLACQSLRLGETDVALAAGVNLILSPLGSIVLSKAQMLSPDGRCKTFDASADGYGRGEGCIVLVLKRLSDAIASGDTIHGVIRGSAVNQDGPSGGLTVPNRMAQEALIREALANADVQPEQIGYLEAHGTGTSLGDPIEVRALWAALRANRPSAPPLHVGSIKTNLGHLESAAGISGLLKLVLALKHRQIPPHLHFRSPNPRIPWDEIKIQIPRVLTPWQVPDGQRRIGGVSSFGASGTNAHVIVEEPPPAPPAEAGDAPYLLSLSAAHPDALRQLASRYADLLGDAAAPPTPDICYTAATGRRHSAHRLAAVFGSPAEARERLAAFVQDEPAPGVSSGRADPAQPPKVAFLFTGQGAQYPGMGRGLYDAHPLFRKLLDQCDEILRPHLERPLLSVLYPEHLEAGAEAPLHDTAYTQPALFALEYALASLWMSWGVKPSVLIGHSLGEYVAACIAGVFSLEDGLKLVAERSRLMQSLPRDGEMVAVFAEEERITAVIAPYSAQVSVATINNLTEIVISGARAAIHEVAAKLEAEGIRMRRIAVSHAFHSPLMDPILDAFERAVAGMKLSPPSIRIISNLTGQVARAEDMTTPAYWRRHLREAVQFTAGVRTMRALGIDTFVEIGPKPTLLGIARRCVPDEPLAWLPSLAEGKDDRTQMLSSLGALYTRGVEIDWAGLERDRRRRRVPLPTYPFQRQRYWADLGDGMEKVSGAQAPAATILPSSVHPLEGHRVRSPAFEEIAFESLFNPDELPVLRDHQVYGSIVISGIFHLGLVRSAIRQIIGLEHGGVLERIAFEQPLFVPEGEARVVQAVLRPVEPELWRFEFYSFNPEADAGARGLQERGAWKLHTRGTVRTSSEAQPAEEQTLSLQEVQARCAEQMTSEAFYTTFCKPGEHYIGPSLQLIEHVYRRDGEALARLREPPDGARDGGSSNAEAMLRELCEAEVAGQLLKATLPGGDAASSVFIGMGFERSRRIPAAQAGRVLWCRASLRTTSDLSEGFAGDLQLLDEQGKVVEEVQGLFCRRVSPEFLRRMVDRRIAGSRPAWRNLDLDALRRGGRDALWERLSGYIRQQVAAIGGFSASELDPQVSLRNLGLDSLLVSELKSSIEEDTKLSLPIAELLQGPSTADLAEWLYGQVTGERRLLPDAAEGAPALAKPNGAPASAASELATWVHRPQPNPDARLRLFCLPYGGGGGSLFRAWPAGLPPWVEVCPIQLPGREERLREPPMSELDRLLDALLVVLPEMLDRPFAFYGCSMGALVAFELTRCLRATRGLKASYLFCAAFPAPHLRSSALRKLDEVLAKETLDAELIRGLALTGLVPDHVLSQSETMKVMWPVLRSDFLTVNNYVYREEAPLECPISAFAGLQDREILRNEVGAWFQHTQAEFYLRTMPGAHLFMDSDREQLLECISRDLCSLDLNAPPLGDRSRMRERA